AQPGWAGRPPMRAATPARAQCIEPIQHDAPPSRTRAARTAVHRLLRLPHLPVAIYEFERAQGVARAAVDDLDRLRVMLVLQMLGVVVEIRPLPVAERVVVLGARRRFVRHVDLDRAVHTRRGARVVVVVLTVVATVVVAVAIVVVLAVMPAIVVAVVVVLAVMP